MPAGLLLHAVRALFWPVIGWREFRLYTVDFTEIGNLVLPVVGFAVGVLYLFVAALVGYVLVVFELNLPLLVVKTFALGFIYLFVLGYISQKVVLIVSREGEPLDAVFLEKHIDTTHVNMKSFKWWGQEGLNHIRDFGVSLFFMLLIMFELSFIYLKYFAPA